MGEEKLWLISCLTLVYNLKPYLAMVSLQFGYAGMFIVTMLCLNHGMSHYVLAVYRHVAATLAIAPFALVLERKTRPKMTLSIFLKVVALGFIEPVLDQNLYYVGMKYTSATFTSAICNVIPAITFIMAIVFRLEKVKIKKIASQAKIIGSIITLLGAMVMILYKGPIVDFISSSEEPNYKHGTNPNPNSSNLHWVIGTLMLLAAVCGWSSFFILQSFTLKQYPSELSLSSLICFMGMIEGAAVTLVMERDMNAWKISWDSTLLAPVYSGIVCSGIAYYVQGIVIKERGPVFVAAFSPLCMIITAALGSILLSEQIHLGSVIGAITIVIGLYGVVWGKSKDHSSSASLTDYKNELPLTNSTKLPVTIDNINGNAKNLQQQGL